MSERFVEIGLSRHAPKAQHTNSFIQQIDLEKAQEEIGSRTEALLKNLDAAPKGAVMIFQPSNVARTEQTKQLYLSTLREKIAGRDDIEVVDVGTDEVQGNALLERMKGEPDKKFIIADIRGTSLIGFRAESPSSPVFDAWRKRLGNDEDLVGKVWSARSEEIPALAKEIVAKGYALGEEEIRPAEFGETPESQIIPILKWMQAVRTLSGKYFPDRPVILEGVSHNMRADFTLLALLGESISIESIDRVLGGKFRVPFERSSVVFGDDGGVRLRYRDIDKMFTAEEFERVVSDIRTKDAERKKEWATS